jgi:hypothetical protein
MTQREKVILGRVYDCVRRLGTLGPKNPADIGALSRADRLASQAAPNLAMAISHLGYGDLREAEDELTHVEQQLGVRGSR